MNIIEVKNNLVKLCYEDDLSLAGLLLIKDNIKSYIAQILHLETTRIGKVAIAKILFNYANKICAYDGSIPSLRAVIEPLDATFLLNTLEHQDPLTLGKVAGHKDNIVVDFSILKDNPIILAEKFFATKVLLNNLAIQLQGRKNKILVFDTVGVFSGKKLTVTKDFKIPLNSSTINYIYEKGFEDATAESKALIQSIFEELSEYSKTVEFIPFDTFKAVVDAEFMRTKLMQLIVMKNKIKQIRDWNVFAQTPNEFAVLKQKLDAEDTIIIDISCLKPSLQQECIKYVYSLLNKLNTEIYAFTPLSNDGSDKFFLAEIFNTQNVHTTVICDYDYPYLSELKKRSKNMLMFTPLKQQKDFGGYNTFLQKLAEDEFIAYGKMSKFVPIIGKLTQLTSNDVFIPKVKETIETIVQPQVTQDPAEETFAQEMQIPEKTYVAEQPIPVEINKESEIQEKIDAPISEEPVEEVVEDNIIQTEEQVVNEEVIENAPEVSDDAEEPQAEANEVQEAPDEVEDAAEPISEDNEDGNIEDLVDNVADEGEEVIENAPEVADDIEEPQAEVNEVQEALDEVEDVEDGEELSDDDLDMIEELSKPDEEIPVLNEKVEQPAEPEPETEPIQEQEQPAEQVPQDVEEEIQNATIPQQAEPLQTRANTNPAVPEYSADIPEEDKVNSDILQQGDRVIHEEFGEGVVEKMINYGDKILCSVNFASVGRRLLNPEISEMKRI